MGNLVHKEMFWPIKEQSHKNNLSHFFYYTKIATLYRAFSLLKPATIISSNYANLLKQKKVFT